MAGPALPDDYEEEEYMEPGATSEKAPAPGTAAAQQKEERSILVSKVRVYRH